MKDLSYTGAYDTNTFKVAAMVEDSGPSDWKIEPGSYTKCQERADNQQIDCGQGVSLRWKRAFTTSDAAKDAQFTVEDKGVARPAFSFIAWYDKDPSAPDAAVLYELNNTGGIKSLTPVSTAFVDALPEP